MKITLKKVPFVPITIDLVEEDDFNMLLNILNFYIDYVDPDDKVDIEYNKICEFRNKLRNLFYD